MLMTNIDQATEQVANIAVAASGGVNWELIIAIAALVVAVIAVILAVIFYLKIKWYVADGCIEDNYGRKPNNIKELIVAAVTNSSRVDNYIMGKYRESIAASRNNHSQPEGGISTAMFNDIVENAARLAMKKLSSSSTYPTTTVRSNNGTKQVLYASSYNQTEGTFYEIGSMPSDQTIFEIILNPNNPNEGSFEVYNAAHEKVLGCKDFLEYCCEVEGNGMHLQTISSGVVKCRGGVWIVESKLKIKFC